jgi:hypothetical protein
MKAAFLCLFASLIGVGALLTPPQSADRNDVIRLAVRPQCGRLSGSVSDVNAGVDLSTIKTIVSFGVSRCSIKVSFEDISMTTDAQHLCLQDSYTDGGGKRDGTPLAPPIIIPPNAQAGGRSTNGKLWIENIADDIGATLMDYAVRFRRCTYNRILKLCGRRRVRSRI